MKSVGVIVEYNPFHNGHAFHLHEAKKVSGADIVVAVMSGNFLQRGEPALVSKWTRAKMALHAGVDIVFELPYQFATQQAESFAYGAVSILSAAGCEAICFGSESGDVSAFEKTVEWIQTHDTLYQQQVNIHIKKGISYPKALSQAYIDLNPNESMIELSKPNNILGFHYVHAARKLELPINMLTIQRKNANYHDEQFSSASIASATSIRKALFIKGQDLLDIKPYVPTSTYRLLLDYKEKYGGFHNWELYWPYLKFKLLQSNPEELREIYEIEEGVENRLLSSVLKADSFEEFMNILKTKRYTWTRLQRICLHILTNAQKKEMKSLSGKVSYLRLLGMTKNGRKYLNNQKHQLRIPLISRVSAYKNNDIDLDIRASRIHSLGLSAQCNIDFLKQEYKEMPIIIN